MNFRKFAPMIIAGSLLGTPIYAGELTQTGEAVVASNGEQKMLRLSGLYRTGDFSATGFAYLYGSEDSGYGELYLREKNIQGEINFGSGMPPIYRGGCILTIPTPKWAYLTAKALPVNVSSGKMKKELQFGTFAAVNAGRLFANNWTDYTLSRGKKSSIQTEFTIGTKLKKGLAIEFQAAHDVNSPGWAYRAGFRYGRKF